MPHEVLKPLLSRRSTSANELQEPGPDDNQLHLILRSAHRVPDHGKIGPWRFLIVRPAAGKRLGRFLRQRFLELNSDAAEKLLDFEEARFTRSPLVIGVVSSTVNDHPKAPEWEQVLSAGAACQNILIAADFLGFGAQWLTEWPAYDRPFLEFLGLKKNEKIAGFIHIGSRKEKAAERPRPALEDRITLVSGD